MGIKTPKQIEDECGAITFLHIKDIINNYKDADMDFSQYTDKFKNMRTNNDKTAYEARTLLYHNIKNTEHRYKRDIFFDNTENDKEKQQNSSNEAYN